MTAQAETALAYVTATVGGLVAGRRLIELPIPARNSLSLVYLNIAGRSTLRAITDASGRILLTNPAAGTLGNLGARILEGPGSFRFDVNLIKRISIAEGKILELRADALDALNKPDFGNPNTDINSVNFGRITSAGANRIVVAGLGFSF